VAPRFAWKKEKRNFSVAGGGGGFILSLLNDYYELDANRHDTETNFKPRLRYNTTRTLMEM
jgi:hypothetical protein